MVIEINELIDYLLIMKVPSTSILLKLFKSVRSIVDSISGKLIK